MNTTIVRRPGAVHKGNCRWIGRWDGGKVADFNEISSEGLGKCLTKVRKYENNRTMPRTTIVLFRESDGSVPMLDWLEELPDKVKDKCVARLRRLGAMGHELRRPEADFLRDGVYELRVGFSGMNYRMLYFFYGNIAAVVSHGLVKEREVPPAEIDRAIWRMRQYLSNPKRHMTEMSL